MKKTATLMSAFAITGAVVLATGIMGAGVAQAATTTATFQLKSANESMCRGTLTLTVTSTTATSRSQIDCYGSPYRTSSLAAQAHLYPAGQRNFDWVDNGCLDCSFAQAIKQVPAQSGATYCGVAGATGSSNVDRPWNGSSVEVCLRAP
ncbi:hypothetical protein [Pseudonocardia abyssalis]|uniref:Uncharacterized protein n=1 Tax=Pseudonocardia abyssalis TaxID=2792008 RepID=A0ABS6USX7_9PSEU|nr:hypothetical protein [Pseudonocardia abyssalis]MBW0114350.1 hypothetical protein [Pseudonocardia abyssalis]MBW0135366.1 hypothetical protein [Pseudonocardia abyssalis]